MVTDLTKFKLLLSFRSMSQTQLLWLTQHSNSKIKPSPPGSSQLDTHDWVTELTGDDCGGPHVTASTELRTKKA